MLSAVPITDPRFVPSKNHGLLSRWALKLIRDERDLPFVRLSMAMALVLVPAAAYLFLPGRFNWWLGTLYLAVLYGFFADRYILMLHNTSHRKLFKKEHRWMNRIIPWVLGPFTGQTPGAFYAHHVGMHHAEANLPDDLSSTMRFQRDSLTHFLRYWARFFFLIVVDLPLYNVRKGKWRRGLSAATVELSSYAFVALLLWLKWQAALVVFMIPFVISRVAMMVGNWGQHAFIDASDPGHAYKNSITTINCRYNRRCFNDGYHIGHHETAARHWTDMPGDFEKKRERYAQHDAIVFSGIDYFGVWWLLMRKRYDRLADHFVELRDDPRTKQEVMSLLRQRTRRIPTTSSATVSS